jgi:hypothetical protein
MANAAPATTTITETTGPGLSVTALKNTDVNGIEFDFLRNWIKVTRAGAGGIQYYDYSALNTVTWSITNGVTSITLST